MKRLLLNPGKCLRKPRPLPPYITVERLDSNSRATEFHGKMIASMPVRYVVRIFHSPLLMEDASRGDDCARAIYVPYVLFRELL